MQATAHQQNPARSPSNAEGDFARNWNVGQAATVDVSDKQDRAQKPDVV